MGEDDVELGKVGGDVVDSIGLEYLSRTPPPPGMPAPIPVVPEWNSAISPASAITS